MYSEEVVVYQYLRLLFLTPNFQAIATFIAKQTGLCLNWLEIPSKDRFSEDNARRNMSCVIRKSDFFMYENMVG